MLSPIRTTFHNSANIVQSSPCQTVSFAGKEYELKVIDEKRLFFFSGLNLILNDIRKMRFQ